MDSQASNQDGRTFDLTVFLTLVTASLLAVLIAICVLVGGSTLWNGKTVNVNTLREPDRILRVGSLKSFGSADIYDVAFDEGVWIVSLPSNRLIALHTECTCDGCTTSLSKANSQLGCPCCGSKFDRDGSVISGTAAKPLNQLEIYLDGDSVVVNCSSQVRDVQSENAFISLTGTN